MSSPPRPPTTTYWTSADRAYFVDRVNKGKIDIDLTDIATIDAIKVKYWDHKSVRSFRENYRKVAADLQVERQVRGGRGK